jgi:DNA polymerase-3 subunit gamma/tau
MNHLPVKKGAHELELKLRNATQQNEINKEKIPLLRALKQTLNNNYISLVISLSQDDNGPRKAFTAADKFKLMLEKNPALKELKNKFGLDIE